MTVTISELNQRASACKAWPGPIPGMANPSGDRVLQVSNGYYTTDELIWTGPPYHQRQEHARETVNSLAPDLSDRATLALLRDIVARAYGGVQCRVRTTSAEPELNGGYFVDVIIEDKMGRPVKRLELDNINAELWVVEALVCALEAAPAPSV